jgi:hypothetical protein
LVIDPVLSYATYLGGSFVDTLSAIAVDTAGNAYVTGWTTSFDFPVTGSTAFQAQNRDTFSLRDDSSSNAFVTKLNRSGTAILYSTYVGGSGVNHLGGDNGSGIAVDQAGDANVTGGTISPDFPITSGAFQQTIKGKYQTGFIFKLNSTGTALIYSSYLGGTEGDQGSAVAIDTVGDAFVTGYTDSLDFPISSSAFQKTNGGAASGGVPNAFVTKMNAGGSGLVYSYYLGGRTGDTASQLTAVDTPM